MIYRVTWTLSTTDVTTSEEFTSASKAENWATYLSEAGARDVVLEEFMVVGKRRYGGSQKTLNLY